MSSAFEKFVTEQAALVDRKNRGYTLGLTAFVFLATLISIWHGSGSFEVGLDYSLWALLAWAPVAAALHFLVLPGIFRVLLGGSSYLIPHSEGAVCLQSESFISFISPVPTSPPRSRLA